MVKRTVQTFLDQVILELGRGNRLEFRDFGVFEIRERKTREREEFVRSFTTLNEMKYQPKLDYRRKRGMIEEINRAVQSVEEDMEVLRAMGARQRVINGPLDYTPSEIDDPDAETPAPAPGPAPTGPANTKTPAPQKGGT